MLENSGIKFFRCKSWLTQFNGHSNESYIYTSDPYFISDLYHSLMLISALRTISRRLAARPLMNTGKLPQTHINQLTNLTHSPRFGFVNVMIDS